MKTISSKWHGLKERLLFRFLPPYVNGLIYLSTLTSKQRLIDEKCNAILVDNTVFGHGVLHESAWISEGPKAWKKHRVETGYLARIPVHPFNDDNDVYRNVCYLPSIAYLAVHNYLKLHTSAELEAERDRQPVGRYSGYQKFGYSVFNDIKFNSVDGFVPTIRSSRKTELQNSTILQRNRLSNSSAPLYISLKQLLGEKNSQDAWHIYTAQKYNQFCFLTMDFKLLRTINNYRNHKLIKELKTKIWSPETFGRHFGLHPIHPHLMSYHKESFFVRADLNLASIRRSKNKN